MSQPQLSLNDNALLTAHSCQFGVSLFNDEKPGRMLNNGMIQFTKVTQFANDCIAKFNAKCGGPKSVARSLSGDNLQKFIMAREILQAPKLLVVAQPTWGGDVGAAAFIRQQLINLRNMGQRY
jgi:ABC-type uncharacterized transport system ATPase subunit